VGVSTAGHRQHHHVLLSASIVHLHVARELITFNRIIIAEGQDKPSAEDSSYCNGEAAAAAAGVGEEVTMPVDIRNVTSKDIERHIEPLLLTCMG
jgi:hypothetical protein